jgi:hypothetical protein
MGGGRSGTTLLDIILGNAEGIFSCGEICHFAKLQGIPHGFNEESEQFAFWKKVEQLFFKKNLDMDYKSLNATVNQVESHKFFLRNVLSLTSKELLTAYYSILHDYFEAIFANIDENIIIDSSKYAGRALSLSRQNIYKVDFIYLIRKPVHVVNSFAKTNVEQPPKDFLSSNIYYFIVNWMCYMVKKKIPEASIITIRYEDLLANPANILKKIQNKFDLNLDMLIKAIEQKHSLKVGNLFEGNRIRLQKELILHTQTAAIEKNWTNQLTNLLNSWWWKAAGRD